MVQLPIVVNMAVDNSKTVFAMALESNLHEVSLSNDTVINATIIQIPTYDGEYTINPSAHNSVILETKDKMCTDDITVMKILTATTSNPFGDTFYIAEVENNGD